MKHIYLQPEDVNQVKHVHMPEAKRNHMAHLIRFVLGDPHFGTLKHVEIQIKTTRVIRQITTNSLTQSETQTVTHKHSSYIFIMSS